MIKMDQYMIKMSNALNCYFNSVNSEDSIFWWSSQKARL